MNELSLVGMKLPHVKYKENFDVSSEAPSASSSFLFLEILPINKKLRRLFREIMFNVVHFINIQTRTHVQYTQVMLIACPALVANVQNGSQNMLSTVPLLSTTSRGNALSWARCPISFGSIMFKLGAKTSDGHQCRAPSLDAA
jgi:hypothetical protein